MLKPLITFEHCQQCRKCCTFRENELSEAPLVTEEIKNRILAEFVEEEIMFEAVGNLWQVILKPNDDVNRWICPLYEPKTAKCLIHHYKPLNCVFWPFYIMCLEKKVVITHSDICPVTNARALEALIRYVKDRLLETMIREACKHPDLVSEYREDTIILFEVDDPALSFRIENR